MEHWLKRLNKGRTTLALTGIFFFTMVGVAVFSDDGVLTVFDYRGDLERLKNSNEMLVEENRKLRDEIDALKSDPRSIEKIAREKLQLVMPEDVVYQVVPQSSSAPPTQN